jgi:type IV pilus assembly protein PilA
MLAMGRERERQAGFTLIELLVVVSIVAVLAAIAIPQFTGRQAKAFDARVISDAKNAALAQEAYFSDFSEYMTGNCIDLPGMKVSEGVTCTTSGTGSSFEVATSHERATKTCTFRNDGEPNLDCQLIGS